MSTYCAPETVLGAGNTAVNEADELSAVVKLSLYWREMAITKQTRNGNMEILDSGTLDEKIKHCYGIVASAKSRPL